MLGKSGLLKEVRTKKIVLKKRLGQNILIDRKIRDRIVAGAHISADDILIEIGAGTGALTEKLIQLSHFVYAIEIDSNLCSYLSEQFKETKNLEVDYANFLKKDLKNLVSALRRRFPGAKSVKIVGNLPYYITSPIIAKIIESNADIQRIVVTVQEEVAERFAAVPGSKRYGAMTLFLQYYADVRIIFRISKSAFYPEPEVDSAVISIVPHSKPPVELKNVEFFFDVIRAGFCKRRKMLKNSLLDVKYKKLSTEKIVESLNKCGIDLNCRAESLGIEDFARLSNVLYENQ